MRTIDKELLNNKNFTIVSEVFKLLSDANRLQIFWILCHEEACVIQLATWLDITSPAVSHHLKLLKEGGLIAGRRDGKEVYYRAAETEQTRELHHAMEQMMQISCPETSGLACMMQPHFQSETTAQEKTIREVHQYLSNNLDKRITIEELSHRFLMNSTTLKSSFKEMYGNSIAAHVKEHRMEKAAKLLETTSMAVGEIAETVGYASQSKFSVAFQEAYGVLPVEYRRRREQNS